MPWDWKPTCANEMPANSVSNLYANDTIPNLYANDAILEYSLIPFRKQMSPLNINSMIDRCATQKRSRETRHRQQYVSNFTACATGIGPGSRITSIIVAERFFVDVAYPSFFTVLIRSRFTIVLILYPLRKLYSNGDLPAFWWPGNRGLLDTPLRDLPPQNSYRIDLPCLCYNA